MSANLYFYDEDPNHFELSFNEKAEYGQEVFRKEHMGPVFGILVSKSWNFWHKEKAYEVGTEMDGTKYTVALSHPVVALFEQSEGKKKFSGLYAIIDNEGLIPQPICYFKPDGKGMYRACSVNSASRVESNKIYTFELNALCWYIDQKEHVSIHKPKESSKGKEEDKSPVKKKEEKSSYFSFFDGLFKDSQKSSSSKGTLKRSAFS